jgi:hypothetical protein
MNRHHIKNLVDIPPREAFHLLLRRLYRRQHADERPDSTSAPIFVLSTGRVGSKTLAALASLSAHIRALHEPSPRLYHLSQLAYTDYDPHANHRLFKEAFLTSRRELLSASASRRKTYMETSPQVTFLAAIIQDAVAGAKFIHLIRDPKAFVRSGMRRRWYSGHAMDDLRIRPLAGAYGHRRWSTWSAFEKNAWVWAETNRWIGAFMANLPLENRLLLKSEDLFGANVGALDDFYRFIGVKTPPDGLINTILKQKLNAQRSGQFPDPAGWTDQMLAELQSIAGPIMAEFDYELEPDGRRI